MAVVDQILEKIGLKYEDLTVVERETLHSWMQALTKNELTISKIKEYIAIMRDGVESELTKTGFGSKQDYLLKARLRNYMLLESFLSTPERAKAAIDRSIAGIASPKSRG